MPAQPAWFHRLEEILALLQQAGARGNLRAQLAGGPWREALSDRHDRRRQQRVAGALRPARQNKNAAKILLLT